MRSTREGSRVNRKYTAVIQRDDDWWTGWIKEISGVNAQERTRDELLVSLGRALEDALEMNAADALEFARDGYEEVEITA